MDEGLLKRLREGAEDVNDGWVCALICDAADALEKIDREYESISKSLDEAVELIRKKIQNTMNFLKRLTPCTSGYFLTLLTSRRLMMNAV